MERTDTKVNTGQTRILDPGAAAWLDALRALVDAAAAVDRLWPGHTGQELDAYTIDTDAQFAAELGDALTAGARHDDAAGALCIDTDGDGLCDLCHVELSVCGACDGTGYHTADCYLADDDQPLAVLVTDKGREAVAALRGAK